MTADIVPELLNQIKQKFEKLLKSNSEFAELKKKIESGSASYIECGRYAEITGECLSTALVDTLTTDVLQNGNIAESILGEMLKQNAEMINAAAEKVQEGINEAAGIGMKPAHVQPNQYEIHKIIDNASGADTSEKLKNALGEPVITHAKKTVDDNIKKNSKLQSRAGLEVRIIRKYDEIGVHYRSDRCDFCLEREGEFTYNEAIKKGVFQRHVGCRCEITYITKKGERQALTNWNRKEREGQVSDPEKKEQEIINKRTVSKEKKRKILENKDANDKMHTEELPDRIMEHPGMLGAYTPKGLKQVLERKGYKVLPLGEGSLKNVDFEDGGGFRINWGGDKYLQYHPGGGHHGADPYYKICSGKTGKKRYDVKGNTKE